MKTFETEEFHVFPDSTAMQLGSAYRSFAEQVVKADFIEAF